MHLIQALHSGAVRGIDEKPAQHVETVMSDVFIYRNIVRKVFKHEKPGVFLDLTDDSARYEYNREDFNWNQRMSPDIHIALRGARNNEGSWELCPPEEGSEWLIEMHRVNDDDTLFRRLLDGTATVSNAQTIARVQTEGIHALTSDYREEYQDLVDIGLYGLWERRIDADLRSFGKLMGKDVDASLTDARIDRLLAFLQTHDYFKQLTTEDATVTIDNHAANVVFYNNKPQFMDIYLVKRAWRLIDRNNNIARIAACVRSLGNDELADSMYEVYREYHELAQPEVTRFQESYNAFIKGYYYTYLKQPEVAKKYFAFADRTLDTLTP